MWKIGLGSGLIGSSVGAMITWLSLQGYAGWLGPLIMVLVGVTGIALVTWHGIDEAEKRARRQQIANEMATWMNFLDEVRKEGLRLTTLEAEAWLAKADSRIDEVLENLRAGIYSVAVAEHFLHATKESHRHPRDNLDVFDRLESLEGKIGYLRIRSKEAETTIKPS